MNPIKPPLEIHSDSRKESNDPKPRKDRKKLGSILNFEKHESDDLHIKNAEKSSGFHHQQQGERKMHKTEEVVKYMAYLPNYLERGETSSKIPFNVGVLDWRLLEKWQHNSDDVSQIKSYQSDPSKAENHRSGEVSSCSFKHTCLDSISNGSGKIKDSQVQQSISKEIRSLNCSSSKEQTTSVSVNPSRRKNLEKSSAPKPRNLDENVKNDVARDPSPTRRFSFSRGGSKGSNSSPLRRLLDPLTTNRTVRSLSGKRESSVKVKSDLKGCKADDIGGKKKNGSLTMQALLQVSIKNGLPLFTFRVDDRRDILAATVKELSSDGTKRWFYTFFSFSAMKKKNAHWRHQQHEGSNHGYRSDIVAQMKVSDIVSTSVREFVLSSVGVTDIDHLQTLELSPHDELAAIVIKFPQMIGGQDGNKISQKFRSCSDSRMGNGNEAAGVDMFNATVILPGGDHGAPSKGEPSPLIERWKSGGSCDCGGWDLGCRIRVLANSNQLSPGLNSTKSQSPAFELFSQEEVEENKFMFILSPFEDGTCSVEFDPSLSLLQAFSIGIAVLNSRTSSSNTSTRNNLSKILKGAPVEISAKYFSYPPLSPVGRV